MKSKTTKAKPRKIPALRRPEVRSLKVYPKHRSNTWSNVNVPEIRLCGNWLEKLGFGINNRVTITTMPGLLIVRLNEEEEEEEDDLPY